jgi:hypothetical protein
LDDVSSLAEGRQTEINRLHAKLREMNEEINRCWLQPLLVALVADKSITISVADPGSGAFLTPGSGIRDG